ncbi:MAG: redoxin domain-containing protein [Blastocatellia bacterium]|nr:redoxin domain-containing protein [Blastocatellia bacterium]
MPNKLNLKIFCTVAWILSAAIGALAQSHRAEAIAVGDMAPDFTLSDSAGKKVTLSDAVKEAPVVLVFYRGYWCPFCAHQLSDLRDLLGKTDKARMYAVSIDPSGKTNEMIKKIEADGKGKITYSFLSDPGAKTIDAYGLRDPRYQDQKFDGIPYPTVYVIGRDRKVAWSKLERDYKTRPTNTEIRAAIEKLAMK